MNYEVTETCAFCESENTLNWNVEKDGYVAYCPHCGNKMMLCDACLHAEDNLGGRCDWRDGENGGCCFRDSRPIKCTYKSSGLNGSTLYIDFSVRRNWLMRCLEDLGLMGEYESVEDFAESSSWEDAYKVYSVAMANNELVK